MVAVARRLDTVGPRVAVAGVPEAEVAREAEVAQAVGQAVGQEPAPGPVVGVGDQEEALAEEVGARPVDRVVDAPEIGLCPETVESPSKAL